MHDELTSASILALAVRAFALVGPLSRAALTAC